MSRAFNLQLSQAEVIKQCASRDIAISAMESLPGGGTRLVCASGSGAELVAARLGRHIIKGEVERAAFRPRRPLW